jgi:hypothetical protein
MNIMKSTIFIGYCKVGLAIFILGSCNNAEREILSKKEIELQKKDLELQERELALKENELAQKDNNYNKQKSPISEPLKEMESRNVDQNELFYIINVAAVKKESDAKKKVQELNENGYQSDYLWIPDYPSLSGALYYSVYIGPFSTQYDCEVATEAYRIKHPEAYGLLVSQDNKRVQINGIGKVTVTKRP